MESKNGACGLTHQQPVTLGSDLANGPFFPQLVHCRFRSYPPADRFATLYERAENRYNFRTFDDYYALDVGRISQRAEIWRQMMQRHELSLRCCVLRFRYVVEFTIETHTTNSFSKHTHAHMEKCKSKNAGLDSFPRIVYPECLPSKVHY